MKLSVITDEISQDFEHALDVMAEYRVPAAELRGLWGTNIADLDTDQVGRARRALAARNMVVSCLATPIFKCELDTDEASVHGRMHLAAARGLSEQAAVLERCCALAHEFDTRLIRVFTFWRRGEMTPSIEDRIVDAFGDLVGIAEREGITLLLENEHSCYVGTGAESARVLSRIASPHVRAVWDPGNALCAGEEPYPAGYEAVRPFLVHVHVKDGHVQPDGAEVRWSVIGEGDIDYDGQFAALRRDGYQGYISLETHYVPENGTPEEGSRPCLAALRRYIED